MDTTQKTQLADIIQLTENLRADLVALKFDYRCSELEDKISELENTLQAAADNVPEPEEDDADEQAAATADYEQKVNELNDKIEQLEGIREACNNLEGTDDAVDELARALNKLRAL